jgi:hypothetical protein
MLLIQAIIDISIYLQTDQFKELYQKKINGLFKKGVFTTVPLLTIFNGIYIFNSQFINKVKNIRTSTVFKKLYLVIQAYNNAEKEFILT